MAERVHWNLPTDGLRGEAAARAALSMLWGPAASQSASKGGLRGPIALFPPPGRYCLNRCRYCPTRRLRAAFARAFSWPAWPAELGDLGLEEDGLLLLPQWRRCAAWRQARPRLSHHAFVRGE